MLTEICAALDRQLHRIITSLQDGISFSDMDWANGKRISQADIDWAKPGNGPIQPLRVLRNKIIANQTEVATDPNDTIHLSNHFNRWAKTRYASTRPVLPVPLAFSDIETLLKGMSPGVCESILFLGVAIKGRNSLTGRHNPHAALFNHLIHARDTTYSHSQHAQFHSPHSPQGEAVQIKDAYAQMRLNIADLLRIQTKSHNSTSVITHTLSLSGTEQQLTPPQVHAAFKVLERYNPKEMEDTFLLGCAGATRNIITCLLAFMEHANALHPYDELNELFDHINLAAFEADKKEKPTATLEIQLSTTYSMLSAIMHGDDHRSHHGRGGPADHTSFFHQRDRDLYRERFDTVRWEVLALAFKYLIVPPTGLAAQLIPHLIRDPIHRLLGPQGPSHFFHLLGARPPPAR